MGRFEDLQERLAPVMALNRPDSTVPHFVVVLPSFSIGESLLSHYRDRIPALEHRFLVAYLMLRIPGARVAMVVSKHPGDEVLDYYLGLLPHVPDARERLHLFVLDDVSPRAVAPKLLDRPDLIAAIRDAADGLPAVVEPWNVTVHERAVAMALDMPINGTPPETWPVAYKSAGRRLMAGAGVPVPTGREHLHTADEAIAAIEALRRDNPELGGVVVKHDDSGAGDGNAVIDLSDLEPPGSRLARSRIRSRVRSLPAWYQADLTKGFVVEERIAGERFSSPSVQIDITPDGDIRVLSSHEQVLGGDGGQVYLGCRFPADEDYAEQICRHAAAIGKALAGAGALGRAAVDFVTAADGDGDWQAYALEINLRRGGTTHPFTVLRHLAPGRYHSESGRYVAETGQAKYYSATDNLVDETWAGLAPADAIDVVADAGLAFDPERGTGVVLHMLSCLAIDGRFGLTAIGNDRADADALVTSVRTAVDEFVRRQPR